MSLGSPLQKAAVRSVTAGFPQAGAYLVDKSPGEEESDTHRGTVSTAVCCGAARNCQKPTEEDENKKPKMKRGKEGREEAVFLKAWLPLQAE